EPDTATAGVNNAAMTAPAATAINATAGKSFTGKVAHFTDANASASNSDFTATIDWADGTTTAGTIVASNSGGFDVTGTHAWRSGGTKVVSVTITGNGGGTASTTTNAAVTNVPVTLTGT